jgi:sec-independent protein translocase protein TatB
MFGLGLGEIILIGVVLLLVVGPDRLPQFMRQAGRWYGQLRRASDDLRRTFVLEADRLDAEERYEKLQERRRAAEEAKRKAQEATGGVSQDSAVGSDVAGSPRGDPARPAASPTPAAPPRPRPVEAGGAPAPVPSANTEADPDERPPGVTAEEWAALPPHVRELLRRVPAPPGEGRA